MFCSSLRTGTWGGSKKRLPRPKRHANFPGAVRGRSDCSRGCMGGRANKGEARALLEELTTRRRTTYVPPSAMAVAYGGVGELDQAVEWLEKGIEERDLMMICSLKFEQLYAPLRGHPRYPALLRKMNLEDSP